LAYRFTDLIRRSYRADLAHRHLTAISGYHRIQASPGYRAAAAYVAEQLTAAGCRVTVHRYAARADHACWGSPGFQEWACENASLYLLDENGQTVETLSDFAAIPTSLIQRSIPVEGEFEVVALGGAKGGIDPTDHRDLDVRGKLVLTAKPVAQVLELAIRQRGAVGILFDGMAMGGRSELDLPDARQYTSFWWAGATPPDGWGFVLSPRQGQRLRARLALGQAIRVRATVDSRFYDGSFEVVDAWIPGAASMPSGTEGNEEVLLVTHLCHPQPSAHDNGSGVAALVEAAAILTRLIAESKLSHPQRGIRFLWLPEMTGTYAWLVEHEADVRRGRWLAGLNLDMVGADQCQTGSTWQLVDLPQASAAFPDHLLSWLREPFLAGQRCEETPFSSGSDHYILSDPTVGIPTPMLIQWPDRFYHTSADTPDRVSQESLRRSGALAAIYAYWVATAGPAEARWLGQWMVTRFAARAGRAAAEAVEAASASDDPTARAEAWRRYQRESAFRLERMTAALATLQRLDPHFRDELTRLWHKATAAGEDADEWVRAALHIGVLPAEDLRPQLLPAGGHGLVPRRVLPGPIDIARELQVHARHLLPEYLAMGEAAGFHDASALLQYWADGQRTVAEIAGLVALETGNDASELAKRYFELLAQAGLVELTAKDI
jgi:aminopeptidase YwaD